MLRDEFKTKEATQIIGCNQRFIPSLTTKFRGNEKPIWEPAKKGTRGEYSFYSYRELLVLALLHECRAFGLSRNWAVGFDRALQLFETKKGKELLTKVAYAYTDILKTIIKNKGYEEVDLDNNEFQHSFIDNLNHLIELAKQLKERIHTCINEDSKQDMQKLLNQIESQIDQYYTFEGTKYKDFKEIIDAQIEKHDWAGLQFKNFNKFYEVFSPLGFNFTNESEFSQFKRNLTLVIYIGHGKELSVLDVNFLINEQQWMKEEFLVDNGFILENKKSQVEKIKLLSSVKIEIDVSKIIKRIIDAIKKME